MRCAFDFLVLLSSTKSITVFLLNSLRERCIIRLIMVLCEVVKLLIELTGLFYSLPGVGREGCPPRALCGFGCRLPARCQVALFLETVPWMLWARPLPAPSCLCLIVSCGPLGNRVPGAGGVSAGSEHPRGLIGISSCLDAEVRNSSRAKAVFPL